LERVHAAAGYQSGASGNGVLVAIIDTGIDVASPEFSGRIDPRSADLVVAGVVPASKQRPASLQDIDGHGTAVASILGAAKNDVGVHGVAPQASLLIFRADSKDDPDVIVGEAISEGTRRAAQNGAKVINYSFGSNETGAQQDFRNLFAFTANNDMVAVISGGNDALPNPEESSLAALSPQARGTVIIAGALNASNAITTFSNRAGSAADYYLSAPGQGIQVPVLGGDGSSLRSFSGTSAAAPFISGAAALVRDLWPHLSAQQVVEILLRTATDLGDPGTDPIYGRGLLNIGAALQPVGAGSSASSNSASVALEDLTFIGSDAFTGATMDLGPIVFVDSYRRAFSASLNDMARKPVPKRSIAGRFVAPGYSTAYSSFGVDGARGLVRFTKLNAVEFDATAAFRQRSELFASDESLGEELSGAVFMDLGVRGAVFMSRGISGSEIERTLRMHPWSANLLSATDNDPFLVGRDSAFAAGASYAILPSFRVSVLAERETEHGQYIDWRWDGAAIPERYLVRAAIDGRRGATNARLDIGFLNESGSFLRATFSNALAEGMEGRTTYASISASQDVARGWRLYAKGGAASSSVSARSGLLEGSEDILLTHFAMAAERNSTFFAGDMIAFGLSKPLTVASGNLLLVAPVGYDALTDSFTFERRLAPLGVGAMPFDVEIGYATLFRGWEMRVNLIQQFRDEREVSDSLTLVARTKLEF